MEMMPARITAGQLRQGQTETVRSMSIGTYETNFESAVMESLCRMRSRFP